VNVRTVKEGVMSIELGAWLRQQREARGLSRPEMARRLIQAGEASGDKSVPGLDSMCHNLYRWERGEDGLSERYRLYCCQALGIPPAQFGPGQPDGQPAAAYPPGTITLAFAPGLPAAPLPTLAPYLVPGQADTALLPPVAVAYRGIQEPDMGDSAIRREVLMAAHEGSEHAEQAEQRGIGDTTLEQMRADVTRLAREYETGEPFPVFLEMRRVRNRMHDALDRRLWPRDAAELYLMIGCLNGLMACAANNLGYPQSAEELIRAGWAYATVIDHRPLMAWLRMGAAYAAYWSGRPRQSGDLARSGLEYLADGQNAAQLHLYQGLAAAAVGDADTARRAIAAARDAREREHHDELLEIGGEFGFSRAAHYYYAGFILSEIRQRTSDAITELEHATESYAAGPGQQEHHSRKCQMLAHTDLATVRLRAGALDAAIAALEPVMALPAGDRTALQSQRLAVVREELAHPIFRGSTQAREVDEQIEEFGRDTIITGLHSFPGSPG
jgi:transcriptional regulator with XRE-family HTH domain